MTNTRNGARISNELSTQDWISLMKELNDLSKLTQIKVENQFTAEDIENLKTFCAHLGAFFKKHQPLINRIAGMSDIPVYECHNEIKWVICTQCRDLIVPNDSGICLSCQGKFDKSNQPDNWDNIHKHSMHESEDLE